MNLRWTCPEEGVTVVGTTEENAEAGVRSHFAQRDHEHLSLSGFTDGGPIIAGSIDDTPASSLIHHHGRCDRCLAWRASADIHEGESFCPRCGGALVETTLHEPHPPIEQMIPGL